MFHRVKSETQQSQEEIQKDLGQNDAVSDVAASTPVTQSAPGQTSHSQSQTQKDTENMSQNQNKAENSTEDTRAENAQSGEQTYQTRPAQTAPRPSNYVSTPYPSAPSSYNSSSAETSTGNDRRLTIGRGITMSGEIESCDHLLVEGTVEAALKGASVLHIAESGVFYGTVEIDEATVAGRFEGDITVHGRLIIRASGVITGSIAYSELEVEAGAVIDGRLTPVAEGQRQSRPAPAPKAKESNVQAPKLKSANKAEQSPANSDGELFSEAKTTAAE